MKLLTFALLVTSSAVASARFEENRDQCKERYGDASIPADRPSASQFTKNGVRIVAHFGKDGRCDWISFTNQVGFSEEEASYLVQVNAWAREPKRTAMIEEAAMAWEAGKPGEFYAALSKDKKKIVICNAAGLEWSQKIDQVGAQANPPKSLEGF